jgi:hypothetical protein
MSCFPPDDGRLRELILHISARCADWGDFDPAMLERMLFQADFLHFRNQGFPITGQAYRRGIRTPAPRAMARVLRTLAREFAILESPLGDGLHVRRRPMALREADLAAFDGQEIATVEQVIWFYRRNWLAACDGPDLLDIPWRLASPREEIPYALALVGPLPASPLPAHADQARAMRLLARNSLAPAA